MRPTETREGDVQERVLSFDDALEVVLQHARQMQGGAIEQVSLHETLHRVLAETVAADRDQPPFNRATRDGYAVRAAEISEGWLDVVGQVRAGKEWTSDMPAHSTIEIMTGAPLPSAADSVVMLEHVEREQNRIRLLADRRLAAGDNVIPHGSEAEAGSVILSPGTIMSPAAIAVTATCGVAAPAVYRRPVVSILATGDELVDLTEMPGPAQIRNSNSYGLEALVTEAGGDARRLPVAHDNREHLLQSVNTARQADLLLLSGGVSMGEYDLVEEVLRGMGAEFHFTGVRMQPGKPIVFGWLPERDGMAALPFFGLPGNPVSAQVTFACFVEPLLRAMRGVEPGVPRFVQATLTQDAEGRKGLTRVLPARLDANRRRPEVRLVPWQGSGDMAANARANCYAVVPEGIDHLRTGDVITILLK